MTAPAPTTRSGPDLATFLRQSAGADGFRVAPYEKRAEKRNRRPRLACRWTLDRDARRLVGSWRAVPAPALS